MRKQVNIAVSKKMSKTTDQDIRRKIGQDIRKMLRDKATSFIDKIKIVKILGSP